MKAILLFPLLFLSTPVSATQVQLFRKVLIKECVAKNQCTYIAPEAPVTTRIEIPLVHVSKGGPGSLHGENHHNVIARGTPFKSDLFLNAKGSGVSVYAVLRSGKGTKRHGITKTVELADLEKSPLRITDTPISRNGKTLTAELIVGLSESALSDPKTVSLGIKFMKDGKIICSARKEVKNEQETQLCEGLKATATIISPTEEQRKLGASLDQIKIAAVDKENRFKPMIIALDNEEASIEMSSGSPKDSMRLEVVPYVIW